MLFNVIINSSWLILFDRIEKILFNSMCLVFFDDFDPFRVSGTKIVEILREDYCYQSIASFHEFIR